VPAVNVAYNQPEDLEEPLDHNNLAPLANTLTIIMPQTASSSALSSYMSQYATLNADITASISKINRWQQSDDSEENGGDISRHYQGIEKNFEEMEELFEQMELEIREIDSETELERNDSQLKSFKAECKRLQAEFQSARVKQQRRADRGDLLRRKNSSTGGESDIYQDHTSNDNLVSENKAHRQRLLDNTEALERSGRKLDQGQEMLEDSQSVGVTILNDLALQRETLSRARNRLRDTDDDLGTSSRILSGMIVRIQQSKIILSLIVVIILCVIIYGVYRSFKG